MYSMIFSYTKDNGTTYIAQQKHLRFKPTNTSCPPREGVSKVTGTGVASFCVRTVVVTRPGLPALIDVCRIQFVKIGNACIYIFIKFKA